MADPIVTDAKTALSDLKKVESALVADEKTDVVWIKAHVAWLIGLGSFAAGMVLMYLIIKK